MADESVEALRVSQLDSTLLDLEILQLIQNQWSKAFKYCKLNKIAAVQPELEAMIALVICKYTLLSRDATLGQELLDISYLHQSTKCPNSYRAKLIFALVTTGGRYLQDRMFDVLNLVSLNHNDKVIKFLHWLETSIKIASLTNFLVFLRRGHYQLLLERILGFRAYFTKQPTLRQLSYEYMNRELLWHGFAEFLFFLLPLINVQRLKNSIKKVFRPAVPTSASPPSQKDMAYCVVCALPPCVPHTMGCRHVFCYYCIMGNVLADARFSCPECGMSTDSSGNVYVLKIKEEKPVS